MSTKLQKQLVKQYKLKHLTYFLRNYIYFYTFIDSGTFYHNLYLFIAYKKNIGFILKSFNSNTQFA